MYFFREIPSNDVNWNAVEATCDSTVFHSQKWTQYLKKIHNKPIVFSVEEENTIIGFFVGVKKWIGITMICAPMDGTGTYTQGLCFKEPVADEKRITVYKELAEWLFKEHKASYLQVDDWQLRITKPDWEAIDCHELLNTFSIKHKMRTTIEISLDIPEEEMWKRLHYKSCKYSINKAQKMGLHTRIIDKFEDIPEFARIHYEHVANVHKRHGTRTKMTQNRKRMQKLCEALFPDRGLMIQVLGNDENGQEQVMSSAIFGFDKGECIYYTSGSYMQYLKYCPNELMLWEAMKILHERGAGTLNFGGMANYKLKFGSQYAFVPKFHFSKYEFIYDLKHLAWKTYHGFRKLIKSE